MWTKDTRNSDQTQKKHTKITDLGFFGGFFGDFFLFFGWSLINTKIIRGCGKKACFWTALIEIYRLTQEKILTAKCFIKIFIKNFLVFVQNFRKNLRNFRKVKFSRTSIFKILNFQNPVFSKSWISKIRYFQNLELPKSIHGFFYS